MIHQCRVFFILQLFSMYLEISAAEEFRGLSLSAALSKANSYMNKATGLAKSLNSPLSANVSKKFSSLSGSASLSRAITGGIEWKNECDRLERMAEEIAGTPVRSRRDSKSDFFSGSSTLGKTITSHNTPTKSLKSSFEAVAAEPKKERLIAALNEWIDRALYVVSPPAATSADETLSLDDAPLLQDYAENNEATPGDTWRDVPDVIDTRGGFKKQLALVIREAPLPSTNQVQSIVDAVYNWIDQIVPGDNSRDFLKYNPFKPKYTSGYASGAPEPLAPDSPVDKSKGAFKSAIRFKILEAFFGE